MKRAARYIAIAGIVALWVAIGLLVTLGTL